MTGRKVEFIVEQSDELQEAPNELKAGTRVTLSNDHSSGKAQIHCEGQLLGQVPVEQQQQLGGSSCTCSLRSIRKQDGKVTQILVRAVVSNSQAKSLPGMRPHESCSCLAVHAATVACTADFCTVEGWYVHISTAVLLSVASRLTCR